MRPIITEIGKGNYMPNRVLRNWVASKKVAKLSAEEERLLTRLVMTVDDYGRFHADPVMIKSICFPRNDTITSTQVAKWLKALGEIIIFYSHKGEDYLEIYNFNQTVRLKKEKYPKPSESIVSEFESRCYADATQMQESCAPETKPNRNESETNPKLKPKRDNDFENSKSPFAQCMASYDFWVEKQTGVKAFINGREAKSLKNIIEFLSKQEKISADPQKISEAWNYILDNWTKTEPFIQKNKKLSQIENNLTNILDQLKNGTPKTFTGTKTSLSDVEAEINRLYPDAAK